MRGYKFALYFSLLIVLILVYLGVLKNIAFSVEHSTDLLNHVRFAQKLLAYSMNHEIYFIPHPLFHILLIIFKQFFGTWEVSAVALLIITIIVLYNVQIHFMAKELNKNFFDFIPAILSFLLLIVSAIYIPIINNWLSPEYFNVMFAGTGTPNVLHNPTYYLVRVFVLPVFFIILVVINSDFKKGWKYYLLFTLLLSLSVLAKPNFAITIIPAIFTLLFLKYIKIQNSYLRILLKISILFSPPVLILFFQFIVSYLAGDRESTIATCFLCVWKRWSVFPPASILLGIGFPLYIFLLDFKKNLKKINYQLAWLNFFFSLFFAIFFYETNYRQFAGNFFWGYNLSLYLLFFISLIEFTRYFINKIKISEIKIWFALGLLGLHVYGGIYHFSIYLH